MQDRLAKDLRPYSVKVTAAAPVLWDESFRKSFYDSFTVAPAEITG